MIKNVMEEPFVFSDCTDILQIMHSEGNMCKPIKEIQLVKPIHTKNAIAHYALLHHNLSGMIIV